MKFNFVSYDGAYPNLCSGYLVFETGGEEYRVKYALQSMDGLDEEWEPQEGLWEVLWDRLPIVLDEDDKVLFRKMVNDNIEHGCCGGCA